MRRALLLVLIAGAAGGCRPPAGAVGAGQVRDAVGRYFADLNREAFQNRSGRYEGILAHGEETHAGVDTVSLYVFALDGKVIGGPGPDAPGVVCQNPNCGLEQAVALVPIVPPRVMPATVQDMHPHDQPRPASGLTSTDVTEVPPESAGAMLYCLNCDTALGDLTSLMARAEARPMFAFLSGTGAEATESAAGSEAPLPDGWHVRVRYFRYLYVRSPHPLAADAAAAAAEPANGFTYRLEATYAGVMEMVHGAILRPVARPVETPVSPRFLPVASRS